MPPTDPPNDPLTQDQQQPAAETEDKDIPETLGPKPQPKLVSTLAAPPPELTVQPNPEWGSLKLHYNWVRPDPSLHNARISALPEGPNPFSDDPVILAAQDEDLNQLEIGLALLHEALPSSGIEEMVPVRWGSRFFSPTGAAMGLGRPLTNGTEGVSPDSYEWVPRMKGETVNDAIERAGRIRGLSRNVGAEAHAAKFSSSFFTLGLADLLPPVERLYAEAKALNPEIEKQSVLNALGKVIPISEDAELPLLGRGTSLDIASLAGLFTPGSPAARVLGWTNNAGTRLVTDSYISTSRAFVARYGPKASQLPRTMTTELDQLIRLAHGTVRDGYIVLPIGVKPELRAAISARTTAVANAARDLSGSTASFKIFTTPSGGIGPGARFAGHQAALQGLTLANTLGAMALYPDQAGEILKDYPQHVASTAVLATGFAAVGEAGTLRSRGRAASGYDTVPGWSKPRRRLGTPVAKDGTYVTVEGLRVNARGEVLGKAPKPTPRTPMTLDDAVRETNGADIQGWDGIRSPDPAVRLIAQHKLAGPPEDIPVGSLRAVNTSALAPNEPAEIPLTYSKGRLIASLPESDGRVRIVDVTDGLDVLDLPGDAHWTFVADPTSTLGYRLEVDKTTNQETLTLDPQDTIQRGAQRWLAWQRHSPSADPPQNIGTLAFALTVNPPVTEARVKAYQGQLEGAAKNLDQYEKTIPDLVDYLAGNDSPDWVRERLLTRLRTGLQYQRDLLDKARRTVDAAAKALEAATGRALAPPPPNTPPIVQASTLEPDDTPARYKYPFPVIEGEPEEQGSDNSRFSRPINEVRFPQGIYSRLEASVDHLAKRHPTGVPAKSLINILRKAPKGISLEEVKETGLARWLETMPENQIVTPEDLKALFAQNGLWMEEQLVNNDPAYYTGMDRLWPSESEQEDRYLLILGVPPQHTTIRTGDTTHRRVWEPRNFRNDWITDFVDPRPTFQLVNEIGGESPSWEQDLLRGQGISYRAPQRPNQAGQSYPADFIAWIPWDFGYSPMPRGDGTMARELEGWSGLREVNTRKGLAIGFAVDTIEKEDNVVTLRFQPLLYRQDNDRSASTLPPGSTLAQGIIDDHFEPFEISVPERVFMSTSGIDGYLEWLLPTDKPAYSLWNMLPDKTREELGSAFMDAMSELGYELVERKPTTVGLGRTLDRAGGRTTGRLSHFDSEFERTQSLSDVAFSVASSANGDPTGTIVESQADWQKRARRMQSGGRNLEERPPANPNGSLPIFRGMDSSGYELVVPYEDGGIGLNPDQRAGNAIIDYLQTISRPVYGNKTVSELSPTLQRILDRLKEGQKKTSEERDKWLDDDDYNQELVFTFLSKDEVQELRKSAMGVLYGTRDAMVRQRVGAASQLLSALPTEIPGMGYEPWWVGRPFFGADALEMTRDNRNRQLQRRGGRWVPDRRLTTEPDQDFPLPLKLSSNPETFGLHRILDHWLKDPFLVDEEYTQLTHMNFMPGIFQRDKYGLIKYLDTTTTESPREIYLDVSSSRYPGSPDVRTTVQLQFASGHETLRSAQHAEKLLGPGWGEIYDTVVKAGRDSVPTGGEGQRIQIDKYYLETSNEAERPVLDSVAETITTKPVSFGGEWTVRNYGDTLENIKKAYPQKWEQLAEYAYDRPDGKPSNALYVKTFLKFAKKHGMDASVQTFGDPTAIGAQRFTISFPDRDAANKARLKALEDASPLAFMSQAPEESSPTINTSTATTRVTVRPELEDTGEAPGRESPLAPPRPGTVPYLRNYHRNSLDDQGTLPIVPTLHGSTSPTREGVLEFVDFLGQTHLAGSRRDNVPSQMTVEAFVKSIPEDIIENLYMETVEASTGRRMSTSLRDESADRTTGLHSRIPQYPALITLLSYRLSTGERVYDTHTILHEIGHHIANSLPPNLLNAIAAEDALAADMAARMGVTREGNASRGYTEYFADEIPKLAQKEFEGLISKVKSKRVAKALIAFRELVYRTLRYVHTRAQQLRANLGLEPLSERRKSKIRTRAQSVQPTQVGYDIARGRYTPAERDFLGSTEMEGPGGFQPRPPDEMSGPVVRQSLAPEDAKAKLEKADQVRRSKDFLYDTYRREFPAEIAGPLTKAGKILDAISSEYLNLQLERENTTDPERLAAIDARLEHLLDVTQKQREYVSQTRKRWKEIQQRRKQGKMFSDTEVPEVDAPEPPSGIIVQESRATGPTPEETRREALDRLGQSGIKRRHVNALTPTERIDHYRMRAEAALMGHRAGSDGPNLSALTAHLNNLKIRTDSTGKIVAPSYFKGWKPTPAELAELNRIHAARLDQLRTLNQALKATTRTGRRIAASPTGRIDDTAPVPMTTEELVSLAHQVLADPNFAESLTPEQFTALMAEMSPRRAAQRLASSVAQAANEPSLLPPDRQAVLDFWDLIQDTKTQWLVETREQASQEASGLPAKGLPRLVSRPYVWFLDHTAALMSWLPITGSRLARPDQAVGPRGNLTNAPDALQQLRSGDLKDSVWGILYGDANTGASGMREFLRRTYVDLRPVFALEKSNPTFARKLLAAVSEAWPENHPEMQRTYKLDPRMAKALELPSDQTTFTMSDVVKVYRKIFDSTMTNLAESRKTQATYDATRKHTVFMQHIPRAVEAIRDALGQNISSASLPPGFLTTNETAFIAWLDDSANWKDLTDLAPSDRARNQIKRHLRALRISYDHYLQAREENATWDRTHKVLTGQMSWNDALQIGPLPIRRDYSPVMSVDNMLRENLEVEFSNPYSVYQYLDEKVFNAFLKARKEDTLPSLYLNEMMGVYLPAMARSIYIDPAVTRAVPKMTELPAHLRAYAEDWIKSLQGRMDPHEAAQQLYLADVLSRERRPQTPNTPRTTTPRAKARRWNFRRKILNKLTTGTFMGAVRASSLGVINILEQLWPMGMTFGHKGIVPKAQAMGHVVGGMVHGGPRDIAQEARYLGSDWAAARLGTTPPEHTPAYFQGSMRALGDEAQHKFRNLTKTAFGKDPLDESLMRAVWNTEYHFQTMVDLWERTSTWNGYYQDALHYARKGLQPELVEGTGQYAIRDTIQDTLLPERYRTHLQADQAALARAKSEAQWYAKYITDLVFSDYSNLGQSPYTRGGYSQLFMQLKRFALNKLDLMFGDLGRATQAREDGLRNARLGFLPEPLRVRAQGVLRGLTPHYLTPRPPGQLLREDVGKQLNLKSSEVLLPDNPPPSWPREETEAYLDMLNGVKGFQGSRVSDAAIEAARRRLLGHGLTMYGTYKLAPHLGVKSLYSLPWFSLGTPVLNLLNSLTELTPMSFSTTLGDPPTSFQRKAQQQFRRNFPSMIMPFGADIRDYRREMEAAIRTAFRDDPEAMRFFLQQLDPSMLDDPTRPLEDLYRAYGGGPSGVDLPKALRRLYLPPPQRPKSMSQMKRDAEAQ